MCTLFSSRDPEIQLLVAASELFSRRANNSGERCEKHFPLQTLSAAKQEDASSLKVIRESEAATLQAAIG